MNRTEVIEIFRQLSNELLSGTQPATTPTVYILGGQPSSGKSSLGAKITASGVDFLVVNGDEYRRYHPSYKTLIKDPSSFSSETQIFSNIFTEELIKESVKRRISVSVEGTMRTPSVVTNTIDQFKQSNYRAELHCIIAPKEYTRINVYYRYMREVEILNRGRLADIDVHDKACDGLLQTLDKTYLDGVADKIRLYSIFGRTIVAEYTKDASGAWGNSTLPSDVVVKSRENQLRDKDLACMMIERGKKCMNYFSSSPAIRANIQTAIDSIVAKTH